MAADKKYPRSIWLLSSLLSLTSAGLIATAPFTYGGTLLSWLGFSGSLTWNPSYLGAIIAVTGLLGITGLLDFALRGGGGSKWITASLVSFSCALAFSPWALSPWPVFIVPLGLMLASFTSGLVAIYQKFLQPIPAIRPPRASVIPPPSPILAETKSFKPSLFALTHKKGQKVSRNVSKEQWLFYVFKPKEDEHIAICLEGILGAKHFVLNASFDALKPTPTKGQVSIGIGYDNDKNYPSTQKHSFALASRVTADKGNQIYEALMVQAAKYMPYTFSASLYSSARAFFAVPAANVTAHNCLSWAVEEMAKFGISLPKGNYIWPSSLFAAIEEREYRNEVPIVGSATASPRIDEQKLSDLIDDMSMQKAIYGLQKNSLCNSENLQMLRQYSQEANSLAIFLDKPYIMVSQAALDQEFAKYAHARQGLIKEIDTSLAQLPSVVNLLITEYLFIGNAELKLSSANNKPPSSICFESQL